MARPTKLNPETQKRLCDAIRLGMTRDRAAEYCGIDRATFYRWIERGANAKTGVFKEFCDALKKAESEGIAVCLRNIHEAAGDKEWNGQWQAAAWILERRHPKEYGKHVVFEEDASKKLADAIENLRVKDE